MRTGFLSLLRVVICCNKLPYLHVPTNDLYLPGETVSWKKTQTIISYECLTFNTWAIQYILNIYYVKKSYPNVLQIL